MGSRGIRAILREFLCGEPLKVAIDCRRAHKVCQFVFLIMVVITVFVVWVFSHEVVAGDTGTVQLVSAIQVLTTNTLYSPAGSAQGEIPQLLMQQSTALVTLGISVTVVFFTYISTCAKNNEIRDKILQRPAAGVSQRVLWMVDLLAFWMLTTGLVAILLGVMAIVALLALPSAVGGLASALALVALIVYLVNWGTLNKDMDTIYQAENVLEESDVIGEPSDDDWK